MGFFRMAMEIKASRSNALSSSPDGTLCEARTRGSSLLATFGTAFATRPMALRNGPMDLKLRSHVFCFGVERFVARILVADR
jgi:hypothetical protein